MSDALCNKYGCDYQLDLDGQVTCSNCGAMDDELNKPVQNKELDRVIAHDEIYKGRVARDKRNYPVMTHDGLLAIIDDNFTKCGDDCESCRRDNASWFALRAVVKLHKPDVFNHCGVCNSYLCETIQAIEEQIK